MGTRVSSPAATCTSVCTPQLHPAPVQSGSVPSPGALTRPLLPAATTMARPGWSSPTNAERPRSSGLVPSCAP